MAFWLWLLLFVALVVAVYHIIRQQRVIRDLADSFERDTLFLFPSNAGPFRSGPFRRLVESINKLIEENRRLRGEHAGQVGQLRATLESMQEAVLIIDRNNQVVLANRASQRIFPEINAGGGRIEQSFRNAGIMDFVNQIRSGGHSHQREIELGRGDERVWVEATGSTIMGLQPDAGDMTLMVLHNITRLKQLEAVRKDFVANVSHELRTPLSMIKGYVETLVDDDGTLPDATRRKFLDTVARHTNRLVLLLDDLLTLSRLENGKRPLARNILYLEDLVTGLADIYRSRMEQHGHTLVLELAAERVPVFADESKILQVFENLIDNAIKYSPDNSTIAVGTRVEDGTVAAWVRDNGVGIAEEDLPRVFERFYRVDKGRSREKGGTGLGLSIVKHVIQLHGGTLDAQSQIGKGTTISFRLPQTQQDGLR